jgi:FkbM family methyltransferase
MLFSFSARLRPFSACRWASSSADGVATFKGSRYCGHNSLNQPVNEEAKAEFQVRTACLNNVLQGARSVDVVKIDAGGAELAVLEGMNHPGQPSRHCAHRRIWGTAATTHR